MFVVLTFYYIHNTDLYEWFELINLTRSLLVWLFLPGWHDSLHHHDSDEHEQSTEEAQLEGGVWSVLVLALLLLTEVHQDRVKILLGLLHRLERTTREMQIVTPWTSQFCYIWIHVLTVWCPFNLCKGNIPKIL